ncbi:MAG: alpha/beta hydrolase [bacterium]
MKIFIPLIIIISCIRCSPENTERYVEINDTQFHYKEYGNGKPTVIFENGMATPMDTWKNIPDAISRKTNVFSYDRAGIGKSDTTSTERTIPNMVIELKQILKKEKIDPPYIYVAHSMGSYLARYYAVHYPDEISALLFVDPSPDKLYDQYTEQEYREFKDLGDQSFANSNTGAKREWESYLNNRKYVQNTSISDSIPIVIISATQWDFYTFHSEMMNNNKNSKHIKIEGSHDIHQEKPELITELIKELLEITK